MLDGIPVFNPYHAAGLFSAWNPDALSQLSLDGASPSPDYPAALSGTVAAATRSPGPRLETRGSMTTTQARLTVDGPLGTTGIGFLLSVRSGLPTLVAPRDPTYLGAKTHDWLAKIQLPLLGGGLRVLGYENENAIDAAASANQPAIGRNLFHWRSRSFGAEWQRTFSRVNLRLQGWSAEGAAASAWKARIGPVELNNSRHDLGFLASVERPRPGGNTLLGLRLEQSRTSYQLQSDSDQPIYSPRTLTPVVTLFGEQQVALGSRALLEVGGSLAASNGGPRLGPRAEVRWSPVSRLTLTGSYIRAHQFAQSLRNAESVVGNVFPADLFLGAGTAGVPVAQSDQGVLALDYHPSPGVKVGAQAYSRRETGLLLVAPSDGEPFTTGSFTVGSGLSQGVSVDASVTGSRFGIVASYALQRVRLSYGSSSYVPDLAATHQLQGGVTFLPPGASPCGSAPPRSSGAGPLGSPAGSNGRPAISRIAGASSPGALTTAESPWGRCDCRRICGRISAPANGGRSRWEGARLRWRSLALSPTSSGGPTCSPMRRTPPRDGLSRSRCGPVLPSCWDSTGVSDRRPAATVTNPPPFGSSSWNHAWSTLGSAARRDAGRSASG